MITMERLSVILRNCGAVKDDQILASDRLQEDLMLNSLSLMLLMLSLEQEQNVALDPTDFAGIATVEDLMGLLRRKG